MNLELMRTVLGWCAIMNIGILLWWSIFIMCAGDFVFRLHNRFIPLTREQFNGIHYAGIAGFKLAIILLNVVPYFALCIVA